MLKTLGMSVRDAYMVRSTHLHKDSPLKPPKQAYTHCATSNMEKDDGLPFLRNGPKHFKKTHGMDFNVCDDNIQDQGRLRILVQAKIFGVVATMTTCSFSSSSSQSM